jgi:hypothetical protein
MPSIPRKDANKALLLAVKATISQVLPPARKAIPMSIDKIPNSRGGAPAAKKPSEGERFDLFRTFRHPPKPAEPIRAPKASDKPKE